MKPSSTLRKHDLTLMKPKVSYKTCYETIVKPISTFIKHNSTLVKPNE